MSHALKSDAAVRSIPATTLEVFGGAGGLALGTHRGGFQHLAVIEWDPSSVQTLRANSRLLLNLDPSQVIEQDARLADYDQYAGKVDLLVGGPPCQPFSAGGLKNGHSDSRDMFPAVLDILATVRPRAVLFENVRGLLRPAFAEYFAYIKLRLRYPHLRRKGGEGWPRHLARLRSVNQSDFPDEEQYLVDYQYLDTADYGVPQRRNRVFIMAFRRDVAIEPFHLPQTHSRAALLREQWITKEYWARHGLEPGEPADDSDQALVRRLERDLFSPDKLPWITVRDALAELPASVRRGEQATLANHVQHPGARAYAGHTGSLLDYPAKALKAGAHGTPGGENILRLASGDVRYLTIREAAVLHTFPNEWVFHGSWGACIRQLGNAVPVRMAELFTSEIRSRLLKSRTATTACASPVST